MARTMDWEFAHPDCDSIIDDSDVDDKIIILAYAANKDGNLELERYRDQYFVTLRELRGGWSFILILAQAFLLLV